MTEITLVLPSALPPPELAADLVRALQTPSLASLLTRTARHQVLPVDEQVRALPHESWLAQHLGLVESGQPAFAISAMRGFGLPAAGGAWFIVNPAHIEIARSHLLMADMRRLQLGEAHSRALFDTAKPYFDEAGKMLLYGDAHTWFMLADDWTDLLTSTPDAATGLNLTDWLPKGPNAREFRKLQNEVQMLWFEHPANVEREARGLAAINSFWPWGLAAQAAPAASPTAAATSRSTNALATSDAPAWLAAIAQQQPATLSALFAASNSGANNGANSGAGHTTLVCDSLSAAANAADWSTWLMQMHRLEETVFAGALAAVRQGRVKQLTLLLSRRGAHSAFTTTSLAQRTFWRRPTLNRLLP